MKNDYFNGNINPTDKNGVQKTTKQIIKEYYAMIGRLGGLSKSSRKQLTSRMNGQKGGRPLGSKNKKKISVDNLSELG